MIALSLAHVCVLDEQLCSPETVKASKAARLTRPPQRSRWDSNPQPSDRQSDALAYCATAPVVLYRQVARRKQL